MDTLKQTAIILLMNIVAVLTVSSQNVTFYSSEFEEGVKMHLGLDVNTNVTQQQMDTITVIDLSGLGIKDIRDVVYLPKIKTLDLSFNEIHDVAPLLPLDSLRNVDLRGNQLEDINLLAFACSDSMMVSVAYNYIEDFSRFFLPSTCQISISGMSAQKNKNTKYFDVYLLFVDIDEGGNPMLFYRGYTNMDSTPYVECEGKRTNAQMDGNTYSIVVPGNPKMTTKVCLTNGEQGDTTWLVPLQTYQVEAGKTVTIESGLPEGYTIQGFTPALQGTMQIDGTTLSYNASNSFEYEEIMYGFYRNDVFKGIAKVILTSEGLSEGLDEVTLTDGIDMTESQSSSLKVSYRDNLLNVRCMSETLADESYIDVFDISGKVLSTKRVDSRHGIDEQINIGRLPKPAIIVRVRSGNKVYSEKLLTL